MDAEGIIIIGGGGHARVLIDILLGQGKNIIGYTEKNSGHDIGLSAVGCIGNDEDIFNYCPDKVFLVNGVGSVNSESLKKREYIFKKFTERGYRFPQVISNHAIVSEFANLQDGVQVMANATVQSCVSIGENSIINTGAIIEHDCNIGNNVHIASGAILCGGVSIGNCSHIGAGATIIQSISVGENVLVAAGAVVIRDILSNSIAMGVPAVNTERDNFV